MSVSQKASAGHQPPRPLVAVSSDWHLKPYNWASRPEIKGDAYRSATFIKDYCLTNHLDLFVLGDITDVRHPDPVTVGFLTDLIDDFALTMHRFYFIQGQHELHRERPWASCHRHAGWLHGRSLGIENIMFYGLDFQPIGELQKELNTIPSATDVLLAHQVWHERMGALRAMSNVPTEGAFTDVPTVRMVISGDFHAHKTTQHKGKDGQSLTAVSPGSTYLKAMDEDPTKYFYVLYNDFSLESVRIPTRPLHRARCGTIEALKDRIDEFTARYDLTRDDDPDKPILYVEFRPSVADAVNILEKACKGRAHLFPRQLQEKERDDLVNTEEVSVEEENTERAPTAIEDFLPRCCKPDSPVFNTAVRIGRAVSAKEEAQQILQEAIAEADKEREEGWNV